MTREQQYDQTNNEGGEGYNPYCGQRDSGEPEWSRVQTKLLKAQDRLNRTDLASPADEVIRTDIATLQARYNAIKPQ
jgi:uncharacterized protein YpuA (DUF1002 family)